MAGIMDEEESDSNEQGVVKEGSVSPKDEEARSADTQDVVEDSLRQRKSQHAKGP